MIPSEADGVLRVAVNAVAWELFGGADAGPDDWADLTADQVRIAERVARHVLHHVAEYCSDGGGLLAAGAEAELRVTDWRCRKAFELPGGLKTRCLLAAGHDGLHQGGGREGLPQQRISWAPGLRAEFESARLDRWAWMDGKRWAPPWRGDDDL